MRRLLHLVWRTLGMLLSGALLGAVVFAGWLLVTPAGARWTLAFVQRGGWVDVQVQGLEGRLIGPLSADSVTVTLPEVTVHVEGLVLNWLPHSLARSAVRVQRLEARLVQVTVQPSTRPTPPSTQPFRVPTLGFDVELRAGHVQRLDLMLPGAEPQRVDAIEVDRFRWAGEELDVRRLAARHAQTGALQLALAARLEPAQVHIDQLDLQRAGTPVAQLAARGSLHLDDSASAIDLDWKHLQWPLDGVPEVFSPQGQLALKGTLADLRAQGVVGLGERARIELQGHYAEQALEASLNWTHLAWPFSGPPRVASERGQLTVQGQPQAYRYTLDADLAAEGQRGQAQAQGSGSLKNLVLDRLQLAVAKTRVDGNAAVVWDPALSVDADLDVQNLDPGLIAPDWPGRLNGQLHARTRLVEGQPRGSFDVTLDDSQLRGYPLALITRGSFQNQNVDLAQMDLRTGATRLSAQGRVTPPFKASAQLDSPDLAALWPELRGRARLEAQLIGPLANPQLIAKGSASRLSLGELQLGSLSLDADVIPEGAWRLQLEAHELSGAAALDRASVAVNGSARAHRIDAAVARPDVAIELGLAGAFDRRREAWDGELVTGRVAAARVAPWTLEGPAALHVDAATQSLDAACWNGAQGRACAQLRHAQDLVRAAFRLEHLDLAEFAAFLPPGWQATGLVNGTGLAELRGSELTQVSADVDLQPLTVSRDGRVVLQTAAGSLRVDEVEGRAQARLSLPLAGDLDGGLLAFDGGLGPATVASERALGGELTLTLPRLDFLLAASPEVESISGRLDGKMRWSGTLAAPRGEGRIALSDSRLHLATPGIELENLKAEVLSNADGLITLSASAQSGKGNVEVSGTANVAGESPSADIRIRGQNFQAANMTIARAWISPDLHLVLAHQRLDLTGDVEVPRAEITPVSFDSGVGPSSDQILLTGKDEQAGGGLAFGADVRIKLGDKVSVDGFGLKTQLSGSVRAIQQPGRPDSGQGEVRLVGGRYKAYGQDLEIETGRLLFNGGPLSEPAVEIRALRKPREDIEVGVFVRGTLDKPVFELYSTPTMPRERQLSWLVLGRAVDETGGTGDEKTLMANAALSLGLSGTDYLAQNLRGGLRLDDISIGADPGEDAQQARFTVGKYLSPKLYVSYGVGIFQPGQVFKLLYDLGRGFKLSTESGIHTGGDLLYTVERP